MVGSARVLCLIPADHSDRLDAAVTPCTQPDDTGPTQFCRRTATGGFILTTITESVRTTGEMLLPHRSSRLCAVPLSIRKHLGKLREGVEREQHPESRPLVTTGACKPHRHEACPIKVWAEALGATKNLKGIANACTAEIYLYTGAVTTFRDQVYADETDHEDAIECHGQAGIHGRLEFPFSVPKRRLDVSCWGNCSYMFKDRHCKKPEPTLKQNNKQNSKQRNITTNQPTKQMTDDENGNYDD